MEACDGRPLPTGRVIARTVDCDSFQDARAFVANGDERGPQMALIAPGTYRINPLLFRIELANVIDIPDNKVGVVTTREGARFATIEVVDMFEVPIAHVGVQRPHGQRPC